MAQQTAVEWLFEKITSNFWDIKECQHLLEQAKQMEKEHIIKAYSSGSNDRLHNFINEQYYNETYNK